MPHARLEKYAGTQEELEVDTLYAYPTQPTEEFDWGDDFDPVCDIYVVLSGEHRVLMSPHSGHADRQLKHYGDIFQDHVMVWGWELAGKPPVRRTFTGHGRYWLVLGHFSEPKRETADAQAAEYVARNAQGEGT